MTDIVIGCSGSDRLCFGSIPRAAGGILDLAGDTDKLDILGLLDVTILVRPGQDERIACGHLSSTTGRFAIGTRIISKCCGDTTIDHDAVILAAIFSDKQLIATLSDTISIAAGDVLVEVSAMPSA